MKTWFVVLSLVFLSPLCFAESISLSTGEVIDGSLIDFPKDVTIKASDGTTTKVPYDKITSIYKNLPPETYSPFLTGDKAKKPLGDKAASAENSFPEVTDEKGPYASPTQTFLTWKNAALKGDIDAMSDCYVSYRKKDVKKDLKKLSKRTREDMQRTMAATIFTPADAFFQGESAIMEVSWTKGLASQTQTLKFEIEGNNREWKILE